MSSINFKIANRSLYTRSGDGRNKRKGKSLSEAVWKTWGLAKRSCSLIGITLPKNTFSPHGSGVAKKSTIIVRNLPCSCVLYWAARSLQVPHLFTYLFGSSLVWNVSAALLPVGADGTWDGDTWLGIHLIHLFLDDTLEVHRVLPEN